MTDLIEKLHHAMEKHFSLTFAKGQTAEAIQVQEPAELPKALSQIGLQEQRPVLVVVKNSPLSPKDYNGSL